MANVPTPNQARELAKSRKAGQETFDPAERNRLARESAEAREAAEIENGKDYRDETPKPTVPLTATGTARKRAAPVRRDDSFAIALRIPAEFEYAVSMEALQAKSAGEFKMGNKREIKQAYIEHVIMEHIKDLFDAHPNPKLAKHAA